MFFIENFLPRFFLLLNLLLLGIGNLYSMSFKDKTSNIKLNSGASFVLNATLNNVKGTLEKNDDSTISGASIVFSDGAIKENGNKIKITGSLENDASRNIVLDGGKIFRGSGGKLYQKIFISGENNCLEGDFDLNGNDVELQDFNATLSTNILGQLSGDVLLNGGKVKMFSNLLFKDKKRIKGPGIVNLNGFTLELGATDISWDDSLYFQEASDLKLRSNMSLSSTWTFDGKAVINGGEKTLTLDEGAEIVVNSNSTLEIRDIIIRGLSGTNIRCIDDTAKIIFRNVTLYLEGDFTFSKGAFELEKEMKILGEYNFIYSSTQVSTIKNKGQLTLDEYVTFLYQPTNGLNNLIEFATGNSLLILEDCAVRASSQGLQLTVGTAYIKGNVYFYCEDNLEGIIIGDDSAAQDFTLKFYAGAMLNVADGALSYRNVNSSSFDLRKDSYLRILDGAYLILDYPIYSVEGIIIKDYGGVIQGEYIEFNDGFYEEEGNRIQLTGKWDIENSSKIILDGNKIYKGDKGKIAKAVDVSNSNNLIEGSFDLAENVEFFDANSELTSAVSGIISGNFLLGGGKLHLQSNLNFKDNKRIVGPGKVLFNGYRLSLGARNMDWSESLFFEEAADLELNSSINLFNDWVFNGYSIITGNSNILALDTNGSIVVRPSSTLLLRNLTLSGVNSSNFRCDGDDSKIIFQNVKLILDNNFSFTKGSFEVLDLLGVHGKYDFVYNTDVTSTVDKHSVLLLDSGVTFSYSPRNTNKDLIEFIDDSSVLYMNGANLYVTTTGLQLEKGRLVVDRVANFYSEVVTGTWGEQFDTILLDEGVTFGNDYANSDFLVEILSGATFNVAQGSISYRNTEASSWLSYNRSSLLKIGSGCRLKLHQILDLNNGSAQFIGNASLIEDPGCYILGPVGRHSL